MRFFKQYILEAKQVWDQTGYVHDLIIHCRIRSDIINNNINLVNIEKSGNIVMTLTQPHPNKGHTVVHESTFTLACA
jgi:hypothetical protein